MSPYHGSSMDIVKKCLSRKSSFNNRLDAPIGRSKMKLKMDKNFFLLGVMNSKSNS
jgi:hypothetical protein